MGALGGAWCVAEQQKGVGALVISKQSQIVSTSRDCLGLHLLHRFGYILLRMSSLAGALVPPDITYNITSADVDMNSSSFDDAPQEHYPKQEEEMGDLFGEDSNVDFVHHSRLVPPPQLYPSLSPQ